MALPNDEAWHGLHGICCKDARFLRRDCEGETREHFACVTGRFALGTTLPPEVSASAGWRCDRYVQRDGTMVSWVGRNGTQSLTPSATHPNASSGTAERIANAYAHKHVACFTDIPGEFGVAIWDPRRSEVTLASDAFQSISIYYHLRHADAFCFDTHAGRLARSVGAAEKLYDDHLVAYLCDLQTEPGATCFRYVRSVPPGTAVTFGNRCITARRYWRPRSVADGRSEAALGEYRTRLFQVVQDVTAGCRLSAVALSGGLDSSSVFRIAHQSNPGNIRSVTCRADRDPASDELEYARLAIAGTGEQLHIVPPAEGLCTEKLLAQAPEPDALVRVSIWATLAKAAGSLGCVSLLTGEPGDMVGGCPTGWQTHLCETKVGRGVVLESLEQQGISTMRAALCVFGIALSARWPAYRTLRLRIASRNFWKFRFLNEIKSEVRDRHSLEERFRFERWGFHTPLVSYGHLLEQCQLRGICRIQRMFRLAEVMSNTAIVSPLMDKRLVQLAASMTPQLRYGNEFGGRHLMRQAIIGVVPEEIRLRRTKTELGALFDGFWRRSLSTSYFQTGGKLMGDLVARPWEDLREKALIAHATVPYGLFQLGLAGAWLQENALQY